MARLFFYLAIIIAFSLAACDNKGSDKELASGTATSTTASVERIGDASRGRSLFIDKGCIICHSVNGIGGKAAPPLDAQTEYDVADPIGFATRMWRGAPAMIELQSLELGYSIGADGRRDLYRRRSARHRIVHLLCRHDRPAFDLQSRARRPKRRVPHRLDSPRSHSPRFAGAYPVRGRLLLAHRVHYRHGRGHDPRRQSLGAADLTSCASAFTRATVHGR